MLFKFTNCASTAAASSIVASASLITCTPKGVFISDLVLQILAYVAETERSFIKTRQAEGIAAAKARGVQFGKPMIPMPENFPELYEEWEANRITIGELAELCNMGRSTMYKRIGEYKERLCQEEGNRR